MQHVIRMVQPHRLIGQRTYVPVDTPESGLGTFTLGGLIKHGEPTWYFLVPLNTDCSDKWLGVYTLFSTVALPDTFWAGAYPAIQAARSMIYDALLHQFRILVASGQVQQFTQPHIEPLGMKKLLLSMIRSEIFHPIIQGLMSALSALRNTIQSELFHVWTAEDVDTLYVSQQFENHGILNLNMKTRNDDEIQVIRTSQGQWCAVCQALGTPIGYDALRFIEYASMTGTNNALKSQDKGYHLQDDYLLTLISKISTRPFLATIPDVFIYLTDRVLESMTFLYVRNKITPMEFKADCTYEILFPNTDVNTLATHYKQWQEFFKDHQVKNEAAQGSEIWKMVPVTSSNLPTQFVEPGSVGVHLASVIKASNMSVVYNLYRPQRVNVVDKSTNLTYNRNEGVPRQTQLIVDDMYYTLTNVTPALFAQQIPPDDDVRRDPEYYPLTFTHGNHYPFQNVTALGVYAIDSLGLAHFQQGLLYAINIGCLIQEKCKDILIPCLDDNNKVKKDAKGNVIYDKLPITFGAWDRISPIAGYDYENKYDLKALFLRFADGRFKGEFFKDTELLKSLPAFHNTDLLSFADRRAYLAKYWAAHAPPKRKGEKTEADLIKQFTPVTDGPKANVTNDLSDRKPINKDLNEVGSDGAK